MDESAGRNDQEDEELAAWIVELAAANAGARMVPRCTERIYQVNYRIRTQESADKGSDDRRRRRLEALLNSLNPDQHVSTTTWRTHLWIPRSEKVAGLLSGPLDLGLDAIHVTEATPNRHILGDMSLER